MLSVAETAAILNVHERTVKRLIQKDELVGCKIGFQWRIKPSDLDSYVANARSNR